MTNSERPAAANFEDVQVGRKLVALRESLGLSQRELARRAGIPNGNISQIEQGKVSPSIQSLQKILAAAGVTLADFFAMRFDCNNPVIAAEDFVHEAYDGVKSNLLALQNEKGEVVLRRDTINPGKQINQKWLDAQGWVIGVVEAGKVQLQLDELSFVLNQGDAFNYQCRRRCQMSNIGDSEAQVVSFLISSKFAVTSV